MDKIPTGELSSVSSSLIERATIARSTAFGGFIFSYLFHVRRVNPNIAAACCWVRFSPLRHSRSSKPVIWPLVLVKLIMRHNVTFIVNLQCIFKVKYHVGISENSATKAKNRLIYMTLNIRWIM